MKAPPPAAAPRNSDMHPAAQAVGSGSFPAFQMLKGPITASRRVAEPSQPARKAQHQEQIAQPHASGAVTGQQQNPAASGAPRRVQHGMLPAPDATVGTGKQQVRQCGSLDF